MKKLLRIDRDLIIDEVIEYMDYYYNNSIPADGDFSRSTQLRMFGDDYLCMAETRDIMLHIHKCFIEGDHSEALVLFEQTFLRTDPSISEFALSMKSYSTK